MPKKQNRGQQWNGPRKSNDKHYFNHDNRIDQEGRHSGEHGGSKPRVSFKNQNSSKNKKFVTKRMELAIRGLDINEDINMMPSTNNNNNERLVTFRGGRGRGSFSTRGRNSPVNHGSRLPLRENCFRVHIPYGNKFAKTELIRLLHSSIAPETFTPIMYNINGHNVTFYIDDRKVAHKLLCSDRTLTTSDGFKIFIKVTPTNLSSKIDNEVKDKIRLAMDKRYVPATNALDLSNFHYDADLSNEYYLPLVRSNVLMAVVDIVASAIPTLQALNLEKNNLMNLERLNILTTKLPELKILYIGENKINHTKQLEVIKELKLNELRLSGNPVCKKYKDRDEDYVSDVRKVFPKLMRLDGVDLPAPIIFEGANEEVTFPPTQMTFIISPGAQEIAQQFLNLYFKIYDEDSRQPLLNAYHDQACFSITINPCSTMQKFGRYLDDNRNLIRTHDPHKRRKMLKQGKLPIVSYLSAIPKTRHCLNSFTLDISLATAQMMIMTVTGLFKEINTKDEAVRFFHRTFIIVPEGSGYCIKNEQLHLSHPTPRQEKNIFNQPLPPPATATATSAAASAAVPTPQQPPQQGPSTSAVTAEPTMEIKEQMTMALCAASNMNLEWSFKCLSERQWNYDNALFIFQECLKRGEIPPEAFKK